MATETRVTVTIYVTSDNEDGKAITAVMREIGDFLPDGWTFEIDGAVEYDTEE